MLRSTHLSLIMILFASAARVSAADQPSVDLFRCSTFNVARVHFDVTYPADTSPSAARFSLAGDHDRVLYSVFFADPVPVGTAGVVDSPRGFQLLFLYRGGDPFGITVTTNLDARPYGEYHASIDPTSARSPGEAQRQLLSRWWKGYRATLESAGRRDAYYPVVETYLSWHLPRRLELGDGSELAAATPTDLLTRPLGTLPEVERLADLFIGSESIRAAMQRDMLLQLSKSTDTRLTQPLPQPIRIPPVNLPEIPEVLAPSKELARRIAKELTFADAGSAQARLQLSGMKDRRVALALDVASYQRLRRASRSGSEFLTLLHRELKVPLRECPAEAARILGMTERCPIAGEYRPVAYPSRGGLSFRSDPFPEGAMEPAEMIRRAQSLEARVSEVLLGLDIALSLDGQSLHSVRVSPPAAGSG